jgi:ArsR family transcriptional regulator
MDYTCCGDTKSGTEISATASLLGIIAEKNRLRILCILKKGEKCVCEIWQDLDIAQNLASHHLKVLKDAGLLNFRKDGMNIFYSINKKGLEKLHSALRKLL